MTSQLIGLGWTFGACALGAGIGFIFDICLTRLPEKVPTSPCGHSEGVLA